MAVSLANLGHEVVAIDMNSDAIMNTRSLAANRPIAQITLVEGDFYSFVPNILFDAVCYFDGFGIGTEEEQQKLLQKIASWLSAGGRAFIEVYTPWHWQHIAGTLMELPDACRKYGFDTAGMRLLDTWWATGHPDDTVTQSLRCYSPDDFELLINGTDLDLVDIRPGGSYDHETKTFHPSVALKDAMQYMAVLAKQQWMRTSDSEGLIRKWQRQESVRQKTLQKEWEPIA